MWTLGYQNVIINVYNLPVTLTELSLWIIQKSGFGNQKFTNICPIHLDQET